MGNVTSVMIYAYKLHTQTVSTHLSLHNLTMIKSAFLVTSFNSYLPN
jgi:hypothetical protein